MSALEYLKGKKVLICSWNECDRFITQYSSTGQVILFSKNMDAKRLIELTIDKTSIGQNAQMKEALIIFEAFTEAPISTTLELFGKIKEWDT